MSNDLIVGIRLVRSVTLCASLMLAFGLSACGRSGSSSDSLSEFSVPVTIRPVWADSQPLPDEFFAVDSTITQSPRIPIYLDRSSPMAGYVPISGAEGSETAAGGELRLVGQLVSDHLGRVYPGAPVHWQGVAEVVTPLPENPTFDRSLFTGTESRLVLAVNEILKDLHTGRAQGGAIITDLVGTGDGAGAQLVGRSLVDWLESTERREGNFHFALIGVKGTYWGAHHQRYCPASPGELGCWYSERMPGWKPRLESPISVPFYVLLFGRDAAMIGDVAISVLRDVKGSGSESVEAVWERLTALDRVIHDTVNVRVFPRDDLKGRQYVLWRSDDRNYGCYRVGEVRFRADFEESQFIPIESSSVWRHGDTPGAFEYPIEGDRFQVGIDCAVVRDADVKPSLHLAGEGTVRLFQDQYNWEPWSTADDHTAEHPERTLQLIYFVREMRTEPKYYAIDEEVVLRGGRQ